MLAVVKTPHIEISINGDGAKEAIAWLSRKFDVSVVSPENAQNEAINIEDSDFWKSMQQNRVGNLLEAARIKAGLTQKQVAVAAGIKQNMVSDFENGRRRMSGRMARRLADALGVNVERLVYKSQK